MYYKITLIQKEIVLISTMRIFLVQNVEVQAKSRYILTIMKYINVRLVITFSMYLRIHTMLYVTLKPQNCPDMPLFRYVWFYSRYIEQLYKITKFNVIHSEFGDMTRVFKSFIFCLIYLPKTIMMEYNLTYFVKYSKYQDFIYGE